MKFIIFLVGITFMNQVLADNSMFEEPILQYQLQAEESYVPNQAVTIRFQLKNLTNKNIWVLRWYTPIEGIRGEIIGVRVK